MGGGGGGGENGMAIKFVVIYFFAPGNGEMIRDADGGDG